MRSLSLLLLLFNACGNSSPTVEVLPGLAVRDTDTARFWEIFCLLLFLIVALPAASAGGLLYYQRTRRLKPAANQETAVAVLEPT